MVPNLPPSLRVGPYRYSLRYLPRAHPILCDEEGVNDSIGNLDGDKETLSIADDLSPGAARATLVHELIHAIFGVVGASQWPGWSEELEELLCASMEAPLLAALKDNPAVVSWLTEEE